MRILTFLVIIIGLLCTIHFVMADSGYDRADCVSDSILYNLYPSKITIVDTESGHYHGYAMYWKWYNYEPNVSRAKYGALYEMDSFDRGLSWSCPELVVEGDTQWNGVLGGIDQPKIGQAYGTIALNQPETYTREECNGGQICEYPNIAGLTTLYSVTNTWSLSQSPWIGYDPRSPDQNSYLNNEGYKVGQRRKDNFYYPTIVMDDQTENAIHVYFGGWKGENELSMPTCPTQGLELNPDYKYCNCFKDWEDTYGSGWWDAISKDLCTGDKIYYGNNLQNAQADPLKINIFSGDSTNTNDSGLNGDQWASETWEPIIWASALRENCSNTVCSDAIAVNDMTVVKIPNGPFVMYFGLYRDTDKFPDEQDRGIVTVATSTDGIHFFENEIKPLEVDWPTGEEYGYSNGGYGAVYDSILEKIILFWTPWNTQGFEFNNTYRIIIDPSDPYTAETYTKVTPSIEYPATCTENNWTYTDGTCQSTNKKIRTWTQLITCENGIQHPTTEEVNCNYQAPECTQNDWTCNTWNTCQPNGTQNRTCTKNITCENGYTPTQTQNCTYTPTCTDSHWDYNLEPGICPSSGIQTKKYFKITNCQNGVTKTDETISCTYNAPQCEYTYSSYGDCVNGIQTRTITNNPTNCQGSPTALTKTCETIPTCTESNWSFTLSNCINGTQTKQWTKISDCNNGITHTNEILSCTTEQEQIDYCGSDDWESRIEPENCPENGTQTRYWTRTNTNCQGGLTHQTTETINCTPTNNQNNNPEPDCYNNNDCLENEKCEQKECVELNCQNGETIANHACQFHDTIINIQDFTTQETIDEINNSNDDEAIELLQEAEQSIINNEEEKATAQINLAHLKTKIKNNPELETTYQQALLALNEGDYETANTLALEALNTKTEPSFPFDITQIAIILMVVLVLLLVIFGRKKPERTLKEKDELLEQLKENAKK